MEGNVKNKYRMKRILEQIIDRNTEGNYLLSSSDKAKMISEILDLFAVSGSLRFSEREVDFAYLCGVFNTSGIDGLHTEIQRLKELGKEPHDIIEACRVQRTNLSI